MNTPLSDQQEELESYVVLKVGVVGAGIAGLSAAIALRRAGHEVEVFERSHFRQEIGAAITVTPNAGRILSHWAFDHQAAAGSTRVTARTVDARTFECVAWHDLTSIIAQDDMPVRAYKRVDMHNELRRLAKSVHEPGTPVSIMLGATVNSIDCANNTINLAQHGPRHKDLIICADGIKSPCLEHVVGHPISSHEVGRAVYRTLIPLQRISKTSDIWKTFERLQWSSIDTPFNLRGTRCDIYPCLASETISIAVYHVKNLESHKYTKDVWNSPATISDVLEVLNGMHHFFSDLIRHATYVNCFSIRIREPVPCMTRCSTALIGDAAHVMQTLHAQGACMGIEDAAALEVMFKEFTRHDNVELRLRLWNQLRLPRVTVAVLFSNAMYYESPEAGSSWAQAAAKYYQGPTPNVITPWTVESQRFLWIYDAFHEAEKALRYKHRLGGLPPNAIEHFGLQLHAEI